MYIICYRQGDGVVHRALVDRQLTRPRAPEVVWGGGALLERDEGPVAEHRVRAVLEGLARQLHDDAARAGPVAVERFHFVLEGPVVEEDSFPGVLERERAQRERRVGLLRQVRVQRAALVVLAVIARRRVEGPEPRLAARRHAVAFYHRHRAHLGAVLVDALGRRALVAVARFGYFDE